MKNKTIVILITILFIAAISLYLNNYLNKEKRFEEGKEIEESGERGKEKEEEDAEEKDEGGGKVSQKPIKIPQKFDPDGSKKYEDLFTFSLETDDENQHFIYKITNKTDKKQVLKYGTSQRFKYELFHTEEGLIISYPENERFLQVFENVQLSPGESVDYEISLPSLEKKGEYRLSVSSAAMEINQSSQEIKFTIK